MRNTLLAATIFIASAAAVQAASATTLSATITDNGTLLKSYSSSSGELGPSTSDAHFSEISFHAGDTPYPSLSSNTFDITKSDHDATTLVVAITETGITQFTGNLSATLTANTLAAGMGFSSVSVADYVDTSNTPYGMATLLLSAKYTGLNAAYSAGPSNTRFSATAPFSETTIYTIAYNDASGCEKEGSNCGGTVSASGAIVGTVPEPASISLLGAGLVGIGMARRRRGAV